MKYLIAVFVFLTFNASWQWWALMCAFMLTEVFMLITKFLEEYKKQRSLLDDKKFNVGPNGKVMTKQDLEAIWNNGYSVGVEHSQMRKH